MNDTNTITTTTPCPPWCEFQGSPVHVLGETADDDGRPVRHHAGPRSRVAGASVCLHVTETAGLGLASVDVDLSCEGLLSSDQARELASQLLELADRADELNARR